MNYSRSLDKGMMLYKYIYIYVFYYYYRYIRTATLIHRTMTKHKDAQRLSTLLKDTRALVKGNGLCRNLCHPVKSTGSSCSTAHTWPCTYRWIFSIHILSSTFGLKSNETSLSGKIMAWPISVSCNWGRINSSLQCQDLTMTTTKPPLRKPS